MTALETISILNQIDIQRFINNLNTNKIHNRLSKDESRIINKLIYDTNAGKCIIVKYDGRNKYNAYKFIIYFFDTKTFQSSLFGHIVRGDIKNYMKPAVCGVGYLGTEYPDIYYADKKLCQKLRSIWKDILRRCYSPDYPRYYDYGGCGIKTSTDWHCFSTFYNDVTSYDSFDREKLLSGELSIDKDKIQSNIDKSHRIYSKETCCFLNRVDQYRYSSFYDYNEVHKKEVIAVYRDGQIDTFSSVHDACDKLNISEPTFYKYINNGMYCKDFIIKYKE